MKKSDEQVIMEQIKQDLDQLKMGQLWIVIQTIILGIILIYMIR